MGGGGDGGEQAAGVSLAASHGHPTALRYQTSHMDKC